MRPRWIWLTFSSILFEIQISILFASNIIKMKGGAVEEVIYGCKTGLEGRTPDCNLSMHSNVFNYVQKAWFMIFRAGIMIEAIDLTDSKAVAIIALVSSVFTQMAQCRRWKKFANKMTLLAIQMGIPFVWSPFLLGVCHP